MNKYVAAAFLIFAVIGSRTARADDDCHVAMDQWQPREAVQAMASSRGWTVTRIRVDDGCYEIRGIDEAGRPFKAKVDPATLAIVKFRNKDRDGDDHGSSLERGLQMESAATGGKPPNALLEADSRPSVLVK